MANIPSLRQLNYLVTLADTLHFTKASERCFVSQSTFSTGIKELEDTIGGLLFERNNKQVRLTQLGQEVTVRATQLLADVHAMMKISSQLAKPFSGDLHLAVIPTIAPFVLASLLDAIAVKHPALRVQIHELQSAQALRALHQGNIDIVLLAKPYPFDELLESPVFNETLSLVIHKAHPLVAQLDVNNADFTNLPFEHLLLLEEGNCLRDHTLSACIKDDKASAMVQYLGVEANSLLTLIQLIQAKVGFAMLPKMAIDAGLLNATPELLAIDVKDPPTRELVFLARKTSTKLQEMKSLTEILQATVV